MDLLITFATSTDAHAAEAASGGLSALGLDAKAFLFQLITFVIILLVLRKFVFPKLVTTLEERRKAVEQSLDQAKEAAEALAKAEEKIEGLLREARVQADDLVKLGHKEAAGIIEAAETKAADRAEYIVGEAKAQMDNELRAARMALKQQTAQLVAAATEQIIRQKLDAKTDNTLIVKALEEAGQGR